MKAQDFIFLHCYSYIKLGSISAVVVIMENDCSLSDSGSFNQSI
jgi:hypothetical protein